MSGCPRQRLRIVITSRGVDSIRRSAQCARQSRHAVDLEGLRIDRAICLDRVEAAVQVLSDSLDDWHSHVRGEQLRQAEHTERKLCLPRGFSIPDGLEAATESHRLAADLSTRHLLAARDSDGTRAAAARQMLLVSHARYLSALDISARAEARAWELAPRGFRPPPLITVGPDCMRCRRCWAGRGRYAAARWRGDWRRGRAPPGRVRSLRSPMSRGARRRGNDPLRTPRSGTPADRRTRCAGCRRTIPVRPADGSRSGCSPGRCRSCG